MTFLRQALRYRRSQGLVLAGISLVIGTCAAFAPWFARAVEQTVTTEALTSQWNSAAWQLKTIPATAGDGPAEPTQPEHLAQLVPADLKQLFTPPVYGWAAAVIWGRGNDRPTVEGRVVWRDGYCAQIELTAGRCPRGLGEIAASAADAKNFGLAVGTTLKAQTASDPTRSTLRVVGIYQADAEATYWFGRRPLGNSRQGSDSQPPLGDFLLAERGTLATGAWGAYASLDTRPRPGSARADDLDRIRQVTDQVEAQIAARGLDAQISSGLIGVIDGIQAERRQATTIIPLVMVQVALFGVVVLALALATVVDQRRPELGVSRLRGSGAGTTGRTLAVELGVPVLVGTLAGAAAGFAMLLAVRAAWLGGEAPLEVPWTVPAAVAVAALAGLTVVALSVRTVVRRPISSLLRRIPLRPRHRTIGLIDLSVIVVASAGLVTGLTSGGRGPLPILTPTLLALAAGLAFAHLLLPAAGLVSRQALRKGRLGLALGALQVARRPAVTRLVAVVAVATGLASFAGQAASVGDRNRDTRAGYETGAEAVLAIDTANLGDFTAAADKVDPERRWLTPVVLTSPPSAESLRAVLIEPDSYRRIAFRGDRLTDAEGLGKLRAPTDPKPIELTGERLTVTADIGNVAPYEPPGNENVLPAPEEPPKSVILQATVVNQRSGGRYLVRFPPMPLGRAGPVTLSTVIGCLPSCELLRLGVSRETGDATGVRGEIAISRLATDTQQIPVGRAQNWKSGQQTDADQGGITAKDGPSGLTLDVTSLGADLNLQHAAVPTPVPALVSPDAVGEALTVPGVDGVAIPIAKLGNPQIPVPRHTDLVAVFDLETARRFGGGVDRATTEFELWLNADGLANVGKVMDGLTAAGVTPTLVDRRSDRIDGYGRSASALALQLTPIVGLASWALAIIVLLLMGVSSWRSRAQDYASLRINGVPATTTGGAARWEQTGPVALAALLGSACGVIGAHIALPMFPLFAETTEPSPIPLDLAINWTGAAVLWLAGTVVLTATTLVLGTSVNRRAGYSRIREELS
jgi:hypothetical protein